MAEIEDLKSKIKELKKKFYQKGSEDKYQLKLKHLIKSSKSEELTVKASKHFLKKTKKIEKKLKKHFKGESKKEKKDAKKKKDKKKSKSNDESTTVTPPSEEKAKKVEEKKQYEVPEGVELNERGQKKGSVTLLLFYAYVNPVWSNAE